MSTFCSVLLLCISLLAGLAYTADHCKLWNDGMWWNLVSLWSRRWSDRGAEAGHAAELQHRRRLQGLGLLHCSRGLFQQNQILQTRYEFQAVFASYLFLIQKLFFWHLPILRNTAGCPCERHVDCPEACWIQNHCGPWLFWKVCSVCSTNKIATLICVQIDYICW